MGMNSTNKLCASDCLPGFGPLVHSLRRRTAFTLLELTVVIVIISILAAVSISILRGRIDSAKWSEANAAAGTIRTAVSAYAARHDVATARSKFVGKKLDDATVQQSLGFVASDLTGTYFVPGDFTITAIDDYGHAVIKVASSQDNAPQGEKTLAADGSWQ
jgi:prepilin-type N-terminal cleavage/methylation domain-containing protein